MTSSLPADYLHAIFKTPGQPLTLERVPLKLPSRGELLVKVEACGVCHSDVFARDNSFGGGHPRVPGHEIVGRVAAVGEGEDAAAGKWKVGERVGGAWHGSHDGTCKACKKGWFQMCESESINGITRDGGYAEYVLLSAHAAVPLPEHIPAAQYAPILCAGVTTFNSLRQLNLPTGSLVAIQGLGGLGHLAIQYAAKAGFRVAALSRTTAKEEFAKKLGARYFIAGSADEQAKQLRELGGAKAVMATAPSSEAIGPLVTGLDAMGTLLIVAVAGDVAVSTGAMISKGISVRAWPSGTPVDSEEAVEFAELNNVECMIETFPLEKANEAFNKMLDGSVRFRSVITMG